MTPFIIELRQLLNKYKNSKEINSETPDFILAPYLANCLEAFELAQEQREKWIGRTLFQDVIEPLSFTVNIGDNSNIST